ncbi:MAG: hypothetical protein AB7N76_08375 [Planctomycetota bacterium]
MQDPYEEYQKNQQGGGNTALKVCGACCLIFFLFICIGSGVVWSMFKDTISIDPQKTAAAYQSALGVPAPSNMTGRFAFDLHLGGFKMQMAMVAEQDPNALAVIACQVPADRRSSSEDAAQMLLLQFQPHLQQFGALTPAFDLHRQVIDTRENEDVLIGGQEVGVKKITGSHDSGVKFVRYVIPLADDRCLIAGGNLDSFDKKTLDAILAQLQPAKGATPAGAKTGEAAKTGQAAKTDEDAKTVEAGAGGD